MNTSDHSQYHHFVLGVSVLMIAGCAATQRAKVSVLDHWDHSGQLALETQDVSVLFRKDNSKILVFSKSGKNRNQRMEIMPWSYQNSADQKLIHCETIQRTDGRVGIEIVFSGKQEQARGIVWMEEGGTLQLAPTQNLDGITIFADIKYGVLPGRILDDVLYDPSTHSDQERLNLPSEQSFVGLMEGNDGMFMCAWPDGNQKAAILLSRAEGHSLQTTALELELDEKPAYLHVIDAPGIWHEFQPLPEHLEKDVELKWNRPFEAKWKTHMIEGDPLKIQTAFAFKNGKSRTWRPGGSFTYPAWFDGTKSFLSFSKKIPPEGHMIIYALEGYASAPVEFANRSCGVVPALRKTESSIGTVGRPGMRNCDGRRYMVKITRQGLQCRETPLVRELLVEFSGNARTYNQRLSDYAGFMQAMKSQVESWQLEVAEDQELLSFLDRMRLNIEKLEQGYAQWMGDRTASQLLQYEKESLDKLKVLVTEEGIESFPETQYLLWECNRSAGMMEIISGRVGGLARDWARDAAHGCVASISAVKFAEEIREEIRSFIGKDRMCETVY